MSESYAYARLIPSNPTSDFNITNLPVIPKTLGIEITDASLAACCSLGNIDPQHGFARGCTVPGSAAIEVALGWPLPPHGATLATIRPDTDSIGAMAVLSLRAKGIRVNADMAARVELVTRSDCFDFGNWASWSASHPPPQPCGTLLALPLHPPEIRALAATIRLNGNDLAASVAMMRDWLLTGALPIAGVAEVRRADGQAAEDWEAGKLPVTQLLGGRLAHIQSDYPGAVSFGYRYAPVVIAEGAVEGKRKITVAQFDSGHIDLATLAARLNAIEPGWGGSVTILGSPQGLATLLEIARIIDIIQEIGAVLRK